MVGRSEVGPFAGWASRGPHDPFAKAPPLVTIKPKYVNMADVTALPANRTAGAESSHPVETDEPVWDIIELLFFAYRDFVGDPDQVLSKFGFGRAHHRVLHFVNRHPGMKVADLLELLRITKQSLGRVLRELVEQGYVVQKAGENDRRQRLLHLTPKGEALAMRLARLQTERILRALADTPGSHEAARRFLAAMIEPKHRQAVLDLIARADRIRRLRR
jgi:DNA-binding MarR family transcriptional regulator